MMTRKRVVDTVRVALSATPIVCRRLSPLLLGRVKSFRAHCGEVREIPERIGRKGFYLPIREDETKQRAPLFASTTKIGLQSNLSISARWLRERFASPSTRARW
jgi:hypothetical protein